MPLVLALLACTEEPVSTEDDQDGDGVAEPDDCNDGDASIFPGATEACDELDNNCDGAIDEGLDLEWWPDNDGDGFGANGSSVKRCAGPAGFANASGDCADDNPAVNPAAIEECNLIDDNCDGKKDDADTIWYTDADGDGYGIESSAVQTCEPPEGAVTQFGDCDDAVATTHPGAEELCNGLDDDCDGLADLGYEATWYNDDDGDGYGHPYISESTCLPEVGWVLDGTDCRPGDATGFPGSAEQCNEVDDNCDGVIDEGYDLDGDSHFDTVCSFGDDCDDSAADVYTGAPELCASGVDEDCDGEDPHCGYDGAYDLGTEYDVLGESDDMAYMGMMINVGDATGDGIDDIFTASYSAQGGYLLPGPLDGNFTMGDVGSKHAGDGRVIYGAGRSIGMGDVDGDGLEDIGFGAPYGNPQGIFVVYGPAASDSDLADAEVQFTTSSSIYAGHGCAIGDISGDGIADLLVGAYYTNEGGGPASGAGYIKYGPVSGEYSLTDDADVVLIGSGASSYTGRWLRAGGDHNGDGIGDLMIAAPYASTGAPSGGTVYMVYGPPAAEVDLGSADGTYYSSSASSYLGENRTFAQGDIDGDGMAEAIVGSTSYSGSTGFMTVTYGPAAGDVDVTGTDIVIQGDSRSMAFGSGPSAADLDDDGQGELLVGAYASSGGAGNAYLFWSPAAGTYVASDADATFAGDSGDAAGMNSGMGDLNGDGWTDLAIGAYTHGGMGAVYAMFNFQ